MSEFNILSEIKLQRRRLLNLCSQLKKENVEEDLKIMKGALALFKKRHKALVKAVTEEEKLTTKYFTEDLFGKYMRKYKIVKQKVRSRGHNVATASISIKEGLPKKVDLEEAMTIQQKRYMQISKAYDKFSSYTVKEYNWLYANLELQYLENIWANFKSMHEELDFLFPETDLEPLLYYKENKFHVTETIYLKLKSGLQNILSTHKNPEQLISQTKKILVTSISEAIEAQMKRYDDIHKILRNYCHSVNDMQTDDPTKIPFVSYFERKKISYMKTLRHRELLEEIWEDCKATHEVIVNAVDEEQQSLPYFKDNMIKKIEILYAYVKFVFNIVTNKIVQPLLKFPVSSACSEDLKTALSLQYTLYKQLEHNKGKMVLQNSNEQIYLDNMWKIFQETHSSILKLVSPTEEKTLPYFKDGMITLYQSLYLTISGVTRGIGICGRRLKDKIEPPVKPDKISDNKTTDNLVLFMPISKLGKKLEFNELLCECFIGCRRYFGNQCYCKKNLALLQFRKSMPNCKTLNDVSIIGRYFRAVNSAILSHDWDRLLFILLHFPTRGFQDGRFYDVFLRAYTILMLNHPIAQTKGLLMEYFHMILGCRTDEDKKAFMKILVSLTKKLRVRDSTVMQEVKMELKEQDSEDGSEFEMEF